MIMTIEKFKEKMNIKFPNENYTIIYAGKNSYENSIIKCLDCGKKIIVNTGELFRNRRKNICSKCQSIRQDTQKNRELINKFWGDEKMVITYPNLTITLKDKSTILVRDLLPGVRYYYYKFDRN